MNIIELHSAVWQQLRARRAQLPHALLIAGQRGSASSSWLALSPNRCSAKTSLLPARPAANAWPAAGWRRATTRTCACCSRVRSPTGGAEAGEGEDAGKKKPSQQITIDQVRAR
jgi:DNA polymerase-3 subunit delta'